MNFQQTISGIQPEIAYHTRLLESQLSKEIYQHRLFQAEQEFLQKELNQFLKEYYLRVGTLFDELAELDKALTQSQHNELAAVGATEYYLAQHDDYYLQVIEQLKKQETRRVYKKLAKQFHPDTSEYGDAAAKVFTMVHEAYQQCNLEKMVRLEVAFDGDYSEDPVEKLERLERELALIKADKEVFAEKIGLLKASSEFHLMRRVKGAARRGIDLVQVIKEKTEREIVLKKSMIALNKLMAEQGS